MRFLGKAIRKKKFLSVYLAILALLIANIVNAEPLLPAGYTLETVATPEAGLVFTDVEFNAQDEMIATKHAYSRRGCDSYIAKINPDGFYSRYAEPCTDGMGSLSFNPDGSPEVYFVEHAGYWDYVYSIVPGGTSGDRQQIASGFVVPVDMDFGPDGNLYVADVYFGTIYQIDPNGTKTAFATGFTIDRTGNIGGYGRFLALTFNSAGELFVADAGHGVIYQVDAEGNATPFATGLDSPGEIAFSPDGQLFVSNRGSLYTVSAEGDVTLFGSGLGIKRITFGPDGNIYGIISGNIVKIYRSTIDATIDIDPDTLNLCSSGRWVTAYISLPDGFDVADIDVATIMLADTVPAELWPSEISYDLDGNKTLKVKFYRNAVQEILTLADNVELTVEGELADGTRFIGADAIRVIDKCKK